MNLKYRLFLDLDGVLADFDEGVRRACGKDPSEMNDRAMWPILARTRDFYAKLPWMSDGKDLWEATKQYNPIILTGVPLGQWAAPQKREWCARELGPHVQVITCLSRNKGKAAAEVLDTDVTPILVDDRLKSQPGWLDVGGIFLLHTSADESIQALAPYIPHLVP